uniref:Uncharacterized protein n=1 Tax=Trypanosoma congolense (strain IL3000) TaxID=1068625 RepID=G0UMN4_TRYCI|nr:conserved hypothetical protein [Trypanosoma congolense IL3000]
MAGKTSKRLQAQLALEAEAPERQVEAFGRKLFRKFTATVKPSVFELQLRYYPDYLHHFGFSVERETVRTREGRMSAVTPECPKVSDLVPSARWGIGEAEKAEADAWARKVGPMEGVRRAREVVERLIEPFKRVTWRHTAVQCSLKKARVLYYWLCENITVEYSGRQAPGEVGATSLTMNSKHDGAKSGAGITRNPKPKLPEIFSPFASMRSFDVCDMVLEQRSADALSMAQVYQRFLQIAGIKSDVVDGFLRRRLPEDSIEWAWNIVYIPWEDEAPFSYLVDVALSAHCGLPFCISSTKGALDDTVKSKPNQKLEGSARGTKAASLQPNKPKRSIFDGPLLAPFCTQEKRFEDFYFNTHPEKFICTHLPKRSRNSLIVSAKRKILWGNEPCLTHDFFRFPVALDPSCRLCSFTTRATPFYIRIFNEKPQHTELCCVLFKGTLANLPDNCGAVEPLGPQWVWHQREESSGSETFTLMVPEVGYYSIVIGAREIRKNPFSNVISEEPFVPVVAYQTLVTFVADPRPHTPRQFLSPSVCKLLAPLAYQIKEGTHHFIVMPSCANVAAAAVVSFNPDDKKRELLAFLPFSPKDVAYTGEVALAGYHEAEVWILYAAPDHNYVNATDLPSLAMQLKPEAPPESPHLESSVQLGGVVTPSHTQQSKLLFVPFVTKIEVKTILPESKRVNFIQPLPVLREEQRLTLRRLIGVTPELEKEAAAVACKKVALVGSHFFTTDAREGICVNVL